jgi:hypothetical protein
MDAVRGRLRDGSSVSPAESDSSGGSKDAIVSMKLTETFLAMWRRSQRSTLAVLIASLALAAGGFAAARTRVARGSEKINLSLSTLVATPSDSGEVSRVRNYPLDFAGDHSLSAATVTEDAKDGRANYTIHLHLASGTEQSVVVAGPPGGLQIEMHDMTGDHVPNDVVLRPALFSWLPTVLVNDGHDHFAVVVAGADAGNFSSPQDLGSRRQNTQTFAFLRSSGFKSIYVPASKRLLVPRLRQFPLSAFAQSCAWGLEPFSTTDRAPPYLTSI